MAAPADLCVAWDRSPPAQRKALLELQQLGFASVAWTYEVNGRLGASHACQIPRPRHDAAPAASSSFTRPVRQHTRLTVHVEDQLHVSSMLTSRSVLLSYDLVAVVPHSELAFEKVTSLPLAELVDVVSLPAGQRAAFPLKAASVRRAVRLGLHFELGYSAALRDGVSRRHFVSNLQGLLPLLPRQKQMVQGLLLSSGADEPRLLHGSWVGKGCVPPARPEVTAPRPPAWCLRGLGAPAHAGAPPPPRGGSARGLRSSAFASAPQSRRVPRPSHHHPRRAPQEVANLATLFGCHPTAAAQAVGANAHAALRRASRLRAPAPLAPPPASGLTALDPEASRDFGSFAALEVVVPQGGAPAAVGGGAKEVAEEEKGAGAGAGGCAAEGRPAAGSKKRRKR